MYIHDVHDVTPSFIIIHVVGLPSESSRRRQEAISSLGVRVKEPAATVAVRGEDEPRVKGYHHGNGLDAG